MVDKNFCMSSYLAFRYIEREEMDFYEGLHHKNAVLPEPSGLIGVSSANEVNAELERYFNALKSEKKPGLLLSGGMDSACLASYMPKGSDAYTFRFESDFAADESERARSFAERNALTLHYVDITWAAVEKCLPLLMKSKAAPVHSIEPQIYLAAVQAMNDGVTKMIIGDAADYVFYGMDGLLSRDWDFNSFIKRSMYIDPYDVLVSPSDMTYLYERYRRGDKIDFIGFYDKCVTEESYGSYENAFKSAEMNFADPYEIFRMSEPVDLDRIRTGESKYIIRELFKMRYPDIEVPEKTPMPRPVDSYFKNWSGPARPEFRKDINMDSLTGNQKWMLYCLEKFLNMYE